KSKDVVGMKIPDWMITDEMKLTENYQLYAKVFGVDVPTAHLAEQKSREELEATQNVEKVKEHLMAEEIEKLEPRSDKESLEVEKIADISQSVNVIGEEEESAEDDYELKRREKGKEIEEPRNTPSPTTTRSLRTHSWLILKREKSQADVAKMITDAIQQERKNLRSEISSQVNDAITNHIPSQLQQEDLPIWLALKYKFERLHVATTLCRPSAVRPRDQDDPHDDAHPKGENDAKSPKTSEHGTFRFKESLSSQDYDSEPDDDVLSNEKVSQKLVDEISHTVDEAKLRKYVDEMLRQQCTSRDEHQYLIYQMQNFLKSDIVWESRKEVLVPPFQPKPTPVVQSCQRDPKAPALPLVNQDLLYLKKGNSRSEKIVLSLHKFPAVIFPDDDIEERTSR
ncbi:hypothetical protein Tco_0601830, partial [Tanacetum coccineum]